MNLENITTTSSEPSNEPVILKWDKLEITEEEYYANIVQPITTQALYVEKEISTIIEVDKDSIEYPAIKNIESQQSTDDSDVLTLKNIDINK